MPDATDLGSGRKLRVTLTQWNAGRDVSANLSVALDLIERAKADRPDLILLPENCLMIGTNEEMRNAALTIDSPEIAALCDAAREANATVILGGFKRRDDVGIVRNTAAVIGPDGFVAGLYDKIHSFNAVVAGQAFQASKVEQAGEQPVIVLINGVKLALTICFDVRFPELYRAAALAGAEVFLVPSAFTFVTGQAHWEVLLRARAIENGAFLVASATVHRKDGAAEAFKTWGHALGIDPWGAVLADLGDTDPAWRTLELDIDRALEVRKNMPVLKGVRPEICGREPLIIAPVPARQPLHA